MIALHDLVDDLRAGKVFGPRFKKKIKDEFHDVSRWLLHVSENAVCFDAGDVEDIPNLKLIPDLFKLPYQVTWVECENRDGNIGLLACEIDDGRIQVGVFNKRLGVAWQFLGVVELYDENSDLRCQEVINSLGSDDPDNEGVYTYMREAANMLARFLMALNCTNTTRVEHKAPKFINAKRAAKGKQPLFSFWTLHLPASSPSGDSLGGTHASPRLHLRRGHPRQYAPGKYTWVQPCVVGNKAAGMVHKDYRLSA